MKNLKQVEKFIICISLLVTLYISLFTCPAFAESSAGIVKNANRLYKNKKYDDALKEYNRALIKSPDSAIINFNTGAAQYKKGDYENAVSSIRKALTAENGKLEVKANYNIGNCKYKQATLKENTDLSSAISLLKDSLAYYKRVIELDEKNKDAKFNHKFVEKKLKELLDKQKKQQKQDDKEDKEKNQKDKQEQQKQNKQQSENKKQKSKEEKESGSNNEKRKQEQTEKEQKQGSESQKQKAEKSKEMSKKEAKMLLEGYRHEEELKDKLKKKRQQGYYPEVLKDW